MRFLIVMLICFGSALMAAPADQTKKQESSAKDPVCGMTVDTKTAEKTTYKGKTYYFCAKEEKAEFEKSPDKYVAKTGKKK